MHSPWTICEQMVTQSKIAVSGTLHYQRPLVFGRLTLIAIV